ncbi:MAG: Mini-circle protein [Frankiales bacterium]|nr:Mini-circle protein [Frankiales bacterium]
MSRPFPEPTAPVGSRKEVLLGYVEFFREVVVAKLRGLPEDQLRTSLLPSGWTPLSLAVHLAAVERRWLVWGFEGEDLEDPWGDSVDGVWRVPDGTSSAAVLDALVDQGRTTRRVVEAHDLDEVGRPGERWGGAPPATLERVLLHLVQEHARHAGQLDVVRELLDGAVGEAG